MDRPKKPTTLSLPKTPTSPVPQPTITFSSSNTILTATLPTHDSVTINLHGATVTSWTLSSGAEQLFLSTAASLDGSKPIRGGIPVVFPVFGPPPKDHQTSKLAQHGLARNNSWEFLGSSSSENITRKGDKANDDGVKLDFGLSAAALGEKNAWGEEFSLIYSVELAPNRLETRMHVQNEGSTPFDFQCLFHTYLRVKDISKTTIQGLVESDYMDKVGTTKKSTESNTALAITGETDRVYRTPKPDTTLTVLEAGKQKLTITRDAMPDVVVWNPWSEKAKGMGDFEPKDGWKEMLCIEPGSINGWIKLEAGDAWEGGAVWSANT